MNFSTHIAEGCLYLLKFLESIRTTFTRILQFLEWHLRREYVNECNDYSWCKDTTDTCKLNLKCAGFTFALTNANDRFFGLVVRVLGYRSGGPGSIPGTTRFSGKKKERKQ
jgi:hypothetical protein